jgi:uncharacterized membrane protein
MSTTTATRSRGWLVPAGLLTLTAVPVLAGAIRLSDLAAGGATADSSRFFDAPAPVVVHIVGATVYCVLGAFQFAPGFRRRRPGWHRAAGRILVPAGIAAALSGMWMALFYDLPAHDGPLLRVFRLMFGAAMVAAIALGFAAILRRDVVHHRAWMMRGYAIAQGAGTQAVLFVFAGTPGQLGRSLLMGAAWALNLVIAEWIIRRAR